MNQLSPDMPRADVALPVVLHRTSHCISHLSERILALEKHVLDAQDPKDGAFLQVSTLQSFDFLRQATEDISAMLARLAETVPPCCDVSRVDVLDPIKLQELRDMIGFHGTDSTEETAMFTGKSVELF